MDEVAMVGGFDMVPPARASSDDDDCRALLPCEELTRGGVDENNECELESKMCYSGVPFEGRGVEQFASGWRLGPPCGMDLTRREGVTVARRRDL